MFQKNSSLRKDARYILWFPLYLLTYFLAERIPMDTYWATQIPLDDWIPFCEWFAIPYCLWYPLLVGIGLYLLFRDSGAFRRYMMFLAVTFFLSAAIWILIPNGQDLRPLVFPRDNPLTRLMALLYNIDTNTNVFPSVHVVGAVGAALATRDSALLQKKKWLRVLIPILSALICISVVFVKQHSILDLLGGLLLSALVAALVYRPQKST